MDPILYTSSAIRQEIWYAPSRVPGGQPGTTGAGQDEQCGVVAVLDGQLQDVAVETPSLVELAELAEPAVVDAEDGVCDDVAMGEPVQTSPRVLGVLGVPTSAGSHNAGQDRAPDAWRSVGLVKHLEAAGVAVEDHGDLDVRRHRPAPRANSVRDLQRVVEVCREVATRSSGRRRPGRYPWSSVVTARSPSVWSRV